MQKTIGRELYTGPRIFIKGDPEQLKKDRFTVAQIGYDDNREINCLAIANKAGTIVYRFGETTVSRVDPDGPVEDEPARPVNAWEAAHRDMNWNALQEISRKALELGIPVERFNALRRSLIAAKVLPYKKNEELEPVDLENIVKAIRANFPDEVKAA